MDWDSSIQADPELCPKEELAASIQNVLISGEYSDLTITCCNKKFEVHKALIFPRSRYFRDACKDGVWKEGQDAVVDLKNDRNLPIPIDDPLLLEYMLRYLYGTNYLEEPENHDTFSMFGSQKKPPKKHRKRSEHMDEQIWRDDESIPHEDEPISSEQGPECPTEVEPRGNATIHAQMCAIADYYGIPDLQKVTRRKFRVALVKICDVQGIVKLFKLVCNPQFQSDSVLRDIMVDKVTKHNNLLDNTEVEEILHKNGELALAIAKRMRSK